MGYQHRLSEQLIEGFQSAREAHNEILATVLREAANIELAGTLRRDYIDRRPNSSAFRKALAQHA